MIFFLACSPDSALAYQQALSGTLPVADAIALCELTGDQARECGAAVVRSRPDTVSADCGGISGSTSRSECFFSVAERHAQARERWLALQTCGQAGPFYAECLYHAWTYELQSTVEFGVSPMEQLDRPVETIRFWASIQSVAGNATEQLWSDWWYFALHGRVARLGDCAGLEVGERERCELGVHHFVSRTVADFLQNPQTSRRARDRVCRGDVEQVLAAIPPFYEADPVLDAAALAGRDLACSAGRTEMQRPWNPIFLEWRAWVAG